LEIDLGTNNSEIQVTIVVPIREYSSQIEITLQSVLEQVEVKFEVILILHPDFKTDFSMIENYFLLPGVRYFFQDQPGLYQAMNQGWTLAKDSLICFMGVGDFFLSKHVLLLVVTAFKPNSYCDLVWGYGPWLFLDQEFNLIYAAIEQNFKSSELLKNTTPICHQTVFMSKALIAKLNGFNTDFSVASDRDMLDRAAQISIPRIWTRPISAYLDGGFSSTHETEGHKELEYLQEIRKNVKYKRKNIFRALNYKYKSKLKDRHVVIEYFSWLPENVRSYLNESN
jgi:glycosyltransferase involved in cell wall biosynthesis